MAALPGPAFAAWADTVKVSCPPDDLQAKIDAANPGDTLEVSGTCTGTFTVDKNLALRGTPSATLDGAGTGPVVTIAAAVTATLDHLTITGGNAPVVGGGILNDGGTLSLTSSIVTGNMSLFDGGGIGNDTGTVTLTSSTVRGNTAEDYGAGIVNDGTLTVISSTISGNTTDGPGAGGIDHNSGTLTISNSTVSGNLSDGNGGGIYNGTSATVESSTITGNTADADTNGGDGGGIDNAGTATLRNTIVSGNTDTGGEAPDCNGFSSGGHNLIGNTTGCGFTPATGDQSGVDPLLRPLADNGGPTMTHALLPGSPATDAGSPASAPTTDQRGVARNLDIGAYELAYCGKVLVNRVGTAAPETLTGTDGSDGVLASGGGDTTSAQARGTTSPRRGAGRTSSSAREETTSSSGRRGTTVSRAVQARTPSRGAEATTP